MLPPLHLPQKFTLPACLSVLLLLGGCVSNESKPEALPTSQNAQPAVAAADNAPAEAGKPANKPECAPAGKTKSKKPAKGTKGAKGAKKGKVDPVEDCVPAAGSAAGPQKAGKAAGGYDLSKNTPVTDSTKVESGQGTQVTGLNGWQGEITGLPAADSKFTRLKIGMPQQQVLDLIGQPTDQGAYVTGKAFIPFYFGSDRSRWEMVYKGQGRLIFANQSGFGTGFYLTWIIHNANEGGYR